MIHGIFTVIDFEVGNDESSSFKDHYNEGRLSAALILSSSVRSEVCFQCRDIEVKHSQISSDQYFAIFLMVSK